MESKPYTLFASRACGSMITEVAFEVAGVPVQVVDVDWSDTGWSSRILGPLNPLGQVPTVLMPNGATVLTESAAIVLHLADLAPGSGLAPPVDHPRRPEYLRWLVWLVAAVYPTFTYADVPERFVEGDAEAGKKLRAGTNAHREALYRQAEAAAGSPWFLGDTWSALDIYVWVMSYWRPGRKWFAAECPKLMAIARRMDDHPVGKKVGARNQLEP